MEEGDVTADDTGSDRDQQHRLKLKAHGQEDEEDTHEDHDDIADLAVPETREDPELTQTILQLCFGGLVLFGLKRLCRGRFCLGDLLSGCRGSLGSFRHHAVGHLSQLGVAFFNAHVTDLRRLFGEVAYPGSEHGVVDHRHVQQE